MPLKSSLLLLFLAWVLASGLQVPRLMALARFTPEAATVFHAEGPAWGSEPGRKKTCTMTLHSREGASLLFGCEGLAWPDNGPGLIAGGYARFTWIMVPYGTFGADQPEPLTIIQGSRIIASSDAAGRVTTLWRDALTMLGLTQLLAIACALYLVIVDRRVRRRVLARAQRASREAKERRRDA